MNIIPYLSHVYDGSILLEWHGENFRFGIVIDKADSSWYYVDRPMKHWHSGYLLPRFMRSGK